MSISGIVIFLIIGIIVVFLAKRIISSLVAVIVFVCAVFLFVFLYTSSGASIDLRAFLPMSWYDNTVKDPVKTAKDIGNKGKEAGEGAYNKINDEGKKIDDKLGITVDSDGVTWKKKGSTESSTEKKSKYVEENTEESSVKNSTKGLSKETIKISEISTYIDKNKALLTKKDRELLKGTSSILTEKINGDTISIEVTKNNTVIITPLNGDD